MKRRFVREAVLSWRAVLQNVYMTNKIQHNQMLLLQIKSQYIHKGKAKTIRKKCPMLLLLCWCSSWLCVYLNAFDLLEKCWMNQTSLFDCTLAQSSKIKQKQRAFHLVSSVTWKCFSFVFLKDWEGRWVSVSVLTGTTDSCVCCSSALCDSADATSPWFSINTHDSPSSWGFSLSLFSCGAPKSP